MNSDIPKFIRTATCPVCGKKTLNLKEMVKTIPHFGDTLIISWICSNCGYKHAETIPLSQTSSFKHVLKVSSKKDLYAKVVRSSTGIILIPELGVVIEPGPAAQSFITNVEGVLQRVKNAIKRIMVLSNSASIKEKCVEALEKCERAIKGELSFTLIIEDPMGISKIISYNDIEF